MKRLFKILLVVVLLGGFLGLISCGGTQASPAPPAEMPVSFTFPASVSVDTSELSAASGSVSAAPVTQKSDPTDKLSYKGTYTQFIEVEKETIDIVDGIVDDRLSLFATIDIPTCTSPIETYERGEVVTEEGTYYPVRVSFGDFQLDPNGSGTEGCTGNSAPIDCDTQVVSCDAHKCTYTGSLRPVCYRIWVDNPSTPEGVYIPYLAGRFDIIPERESDGFDKDTPGQGEFRIMTESEEVATTETINVGTIYNHYDPTDTNYEFVDMHVEDHIVDNSTGQDTFDNKIRLSVLQETINIGSYPWPRKTVQHYSSNLGETLLQYISRFLEDGYYWRGTIWDTSTYNQCVEIASGDPADTTDELVALECELISVAGATAPTYIEGRQDFPNDNAAGFPDDSCSVASFTGCP